jgi:glycosyltransferase involved in cell wall biosynthesis
MLNSRRAWFTDTIDDLNGVANTIRGMAAAVVADGHSLTVVTSRTSIDIPGIPLENFQPLAEFKLPAYRVQTLGVPPLLKMLDFIRSGGFTELIISTPGPVGLAALLIARILRLRTAGIYHTDFPKYARILSGSEWWEITGWACMKWFYSQTDIMWVNSESYRQDWVARGMPLEKVRILPRGVDTQLFHPNRRSADFWPRRGVPSGATLLLYVGRISKEKDIDVIASAWERLRRPGLALAFVGDGPYLTALRDTLRDAIFTGALHGEELAQAYASADIFLFPSTTDTFGNVIIEALASGLPCVVSDVGGPKDLVEPGVTGLVTRGLDVEDFTRAVTRLADDPALRSQMQSAASRSVAGRDWQNAARRFWAATAP